MAEHSWISAEQQAGVIKQLQESLQLLVFTKGHLASHNEGNWAQLAVALEARAFRAAVFYAEAVEERCPSTSEVQRVYAKEASQLLIDEVTRMTQATARQPSLPRTFSLNPVPEGLRKVHTNHCATRRISPTAVWGWLVPGSRGLQQNVALRGGGVAIGRGKEAMWACIANSQSPRMASSPQRAGMQQRMQEVARRNLRFVEVADGRVSRLHCLITLTLSDNGPAAMLEDCSSNGTFLNGGKLAKGERVALQDGDRVSLVLSVAPLAEQFFTFRAPCPAFPAACPADADADADLPWADAAAHLPPLPLDSPASPSQASPKPEGAQQQQQQGSSSLAPVSTSLWRTATSRYTTAEQSTLEDLSCQICLGPLAACLALEPCGHNFCAACLSLHFATQSLGGMQLACPFRCPAPERVVINHAVRALVDLLQQQQRALPPAAPSMPPRPFADAQHARYSSTLPAATSPPSSSHPTPGPPYARSQQRTASPAAAAASSSSPPAMRAAGSGRQGSDGSCPSLLSTSDSSPHTTGYESGSDVEDSRSGTDAEGSGGSGDGPGMSALFPLHDALLPMDAAALKAKQVEVALQQLKSPGQDAAAHNVSLEALARLAWSDNAVREAVASSGGIIAIVDVMREHREHDGVQCNACLALMALVRGEGDVCQANQWHIAKAGAVEAIVQAMQTFEHSSSVQLSALLCCIPLVLDNTMMQAHLTVAALPRVLAALAAFPQEPDIQTKGLVLLGVLMQGEDVVHDAVRQKELEAGLTGCIAAALRHLHDHDDVLWAALFCLAVLVRDSSKVHVQAARAVARSGMHKLLLEMVAAYRARQAAAGVEADEMIVCTGECLSLLLQPLLRQLQWEKYCLAAGVVVGLGVGWAAVSMLRAWAQGADAGRV